MSQPEQTTLPAPSAWDRFAEELRASARWVDALDICADPVIRAQGARYVGRMAIAALHHEVEFADPLFPQWFRCIDQVNNWGGPNVDNEYLSAAVDPSCTYRVHADLSRSAGLLLQSIRGIWHLPEKGFAVLDDWSIDDFEVNGDGTFELYLGGPQRSDVNWAPLHPEAERLWLRQYGTAWDEHSVGGFSITRIDEGGPLTPPVLTDEQIADQVGKAADWLGGAVRHWPQSLLDRSQPLSVNRLPKPFVSSQGSAQISYALSRLDLDRSQAMVLEFEEPDARYWSLQLYSYPWWESLDARNGLTSLNHDQLTADPDGKVRVVVSVADPGVRNWIDCSTSPQALLMMRCVWAKDPVAPISRLLTLDELSEVDASHYGGRVQPVQRREQLVTRRRDADRWMRGAAR